MTMENLIDSLQSLRDIYFSYPKRHEIVQNELRKVNNEIQDVLHVIELCDLDAVGMSRMYKELKKLRKERRNLKNEDEVLREVEFFSSVGRPSEHQINSAIGQVRSVKEKQTKRIYTTKARKDLQPLINKRR